MSPTRSLPMREDTAMTSYSLSGADIWRLMRIHHKTIRGLAAEFAITQKRVRQLRSAGATGFNAEEVHFMCAGRWPLDLGGTP